MYYLKSTDGIGGATTNSKPMADALINTGEFVLCDVAEYRKAMRAAERADEQAADDEYQEMLRIKRS